MTPREQELRVAIQCVVDAYISGQPEDMETAIDGCAAMLADVEGELLAEEADHADSVTAMRDEIATLRHALRGLLEYTGGRDLTDPTHPIVIARKAMEGGEA